MVYSNRRLKMKMEGGIDGKEAIPIPLSSREYRFAATAGSSINVTSQKAKIVFGDEYLALTNKQRYQAICKEWENERKKDEESSSASDNEEDGNPTNDQESAIMKCISGDVEESDCDSAELSTPDAGDSRDDGFQAMRMGDDGVKAPLPLHAISLDDLKTYIKQLNRTRASSIPSTVRGQEVAARLFEGMKPPIDISFPHTHSANQQMVSPIKLGAGPKPVTTSDVLDDIVRQKRERGSVSQSPIQSVSITQRRAANQDASGPAEGAASPEPHVKGLSRGEDSLNSKVCRFCGKPLIDGYNDHVRDGYEEIGPRASQDYTGDCGRLGEKLWLVWDTVSRIRLTAVMMKEDGGEMPGHEQFADEHGKIVRFCPLAMNLNHQRVESLRLLKTHRAMEKKSRYNSNKRRRYHERRTTGDGEVADNIIEGTTLDKMDVNTAVAANTIGGAGIFSQFCD
ncbi:hypothetical protein Pmar_PMAR014443 [Perkinsus marinus ATCC 50983]|uniref:Uncharacterized protein n=1 Tax=Perkinsus marinus (strain ATCC 50983 / TXsc) TaxID=423536 RepID=C5KXY2_PERM5|nr:hypothetical protein Pmar_PMAR014443 [Perkinsus marinus ATCC 50983]EER10668.1 hypothetical protein Pmar_PMAR014443 [Perkinsus marinus ATCC 50983]|eukprot:XP_002778873.1 hypothetical protein Pmar_PMAR014443 [Perkinsus marinus ATCC 50983]